MVTSLGKEAYAAARNQTEQKLDPMKRAFIALANENRINGQIKSSASSSDSSSTQSCQK